MPGSSVVQETFFGLRKQTPCMSLRLMGFDILLQAGLGLKQERQGAGTGFRRMYEPCLDRRWPSMTMPCNSARFLFIAVPFRAVYSPMTLTSTRLGRLPSNLP